MSDQSRDPTSPGSQGPSAVRSGGAPGLSDSAPPEQWQDLYRTLVENVQDGLFIIQGGKLIYVNEAFATMVGGTAQDIIGLDLAELVAPEDRTLVVDRHRRRQAGEDVISSYEFRMLHRDGSSRVDVHMTVGVVDYRGRVASMGTVKDVTEQKHALEELRRSEQRFRELAEMMPETVFETDARGVFTFVNQAGYEVFGFSPTDLAAGHRCLDRIHPSDRERATKNVQRALQGHGTGLNEYRVLRRDGSEFPCLIHSAPIVRDGQTVGLRGFLIELSRRKRIEAQLRQAQRLQAVGTLAGGVAHNVNNLLMGIQGRISLMLADLDPGHPHVQHLEEVEACIRSGATLTEQLLGFARGGRYEVKLLDLNEVADTTVEMFACTRKDLDVRRELAPTLRPTEADRSQLEQALLNLLLNAAQAMPDGGTITVATQDVQLDREAVAEYGLPAGPFVKLSVRDTGEGMDGATLERVFEPFFTTRQLGQGAGLGLASVYGTVRSHGGFVTVRSEPARGTTFDVLLPAASGTVQPHQLPRPTAVQGSGTVLLVDDEAGIRAIGTRLLQKLGYTALAAGTGEQALEQLERGPVDLIVLDLVMPGLSGQALFERLRAIQPGVKVLLASGYTPDEQARTLLAQGCQGFIQKPFGLQEFATRIDELLTAGDD